MESKAEEAHSASEGDSDLGTLMESFSEGLHFDGSLDSDLASTKPAKRSHPGAGWDKVSPHPKKVDLEATPVYDRNGPISPIPPPPPSAEFPLTSPLSPLLEDPNCEAPFHLHRACAKLLVIGSVCAEHDTGAYHQENSQRTCLLCGDRGCLRRKPLDGALEWVNADQLPHAPLVDLLRVHEYEYLAYLEQRIASLATSGSTCPPFYAPNGMLDVDTPLVKESLSTAKKVCSAVIYAVDAVMNKQENTDRAFVIGRPPGHHAGPSGCVVASNFWQRPTVASSGFCLLNNVAVGAAYARYRYGRENCDKAPRIAIVDIDVHHGNGTEEIVRNLRPHQAFLPLPSSWAPVSKLSYKPWLNEKDADEVFFCSIHKFDGEGFYPATGDEKQNVEGENIVNICLTPLPSRDPKKKGRKLEDLMKAASDELKEKVMRLLLPRLHAFKPDLLFISAGFDAHYDDMYHYLSEQDIHWVTKELCAVNEAVGGQGVISVLEGGYSLSTEIPVEQVSSPTSASESSGSMHLRAKGKVKQEAVLPAPKTVLNKFSIQPGDGGLVKSVLAHTAALSRREEWQQTQA